MMGDNEEMRNALIGMSEAIGGMQEAVSSLKSSMETGRAQAIERNKEMQEHLDSVAKDVSEMKPHVQQFVVVKKHIVRAALVSLATSLGLNAHAVGDFINEIIGSIK